MGKKTEGTKKKKGTKRSGGNGVLDLPVDFLGVSIGDGTARVGLKIARHLMVLAEAERNLCGRRLQGRIVLVPGDDDPDQTYLVEGLKHEVDGVFDVKRFSVSPQCIGCGLTFSLHEIDIRQLALFAKKQGRLLITDVQDIPLPAKDDDEPVEVKTTSAPV